MTNTRPILKRRQPPKRQARPEAPAAESRALPVVAGPLIERVPVPHGQPRIVVTPSGLVMLEALAADGAPQSMGASTLGISISAFKKMLASEDDNGNIPVALAWQRGVATLEHEVSRYLLTSMRKGNVIAAIFFSKARLGWSESPPVTNQVGVQIVLPDSLSSEDYGKRVAERTAVTIISPAEETNEPRRLIRRKTPDDGALQ